MKNKSNDIITNAFKPYFIWRKTQVPKDPEMSKL